MSRRIAAACALVLVLGVVQAASGDVGTRKQAVDSKLARLHEQIAAAQQREHTLSDEIASVTTQIRGLEARVGDVSQRLATLENDLALHRRKLVRLAELYRVETKRYLFLKRQYAISVARMDARLVEVYETGDPDSLEVLLSARSFSDVLDTIDYIRAINRQDRDIVHAVGQAKKAAKRAREQTKKLKDVVAGETRVVAARTEQVRATRDRLLASRRELASARAQKRVSLAHVQASERDEVAEAQALEQVSAQLGAQIRAAQAAAAARTSSASSSSGSSAPTGAPSSSGFIWPVNGPVVSPFGMRWGRMHTGIDIAVSFGTPIHAAASGTVIYASWMSGYGNLVFIDHGGGLSTGYAHQSQIAVGNGQHVSQGQVIGYVGCTGHCFGPHLHFEVRVNGTPVDPLGYL